MSENKAEDLNGAKRGAGCLGLLLIIIGLMVIGYTGDAGSSLGAIIAFVGGLCWLAAIIFGVAAKSGANKMAQAIESLRVAHNAGLELRQIMGMLGLLEEALRQSEAESNIAQVMEDVSKAFAKGNMLLISGR
ncbi:MAG: hypothetical protein ACRD82_03970, partial [Blastocatellia bacterium]